MGSANLSPVIQAFLQGHKQQSDLIGQAREILDRQQQIKNQDAERQQRQQQIDEIVRQHNIENKKDQDRLGLEHDIFQLNVKKAHMDAQDKVIAGLKDQSIPLQFGAAPSALIPGLPGVPGGQPTTLPGAGIPTVAPTQSVDTPFGKITVATPQTNTQDVVAQNAAVEPGKLDLLRKQADIESDAYVKKMMPELNNKLSVQQAISDARIAAMERGQDMREKLGEIQSTQRMNNMLMMAGVNPDPGAFKNQVGTIIHQAAVGNAGPNLTQEYGPILGRAAENGLAASGFKKLDPKDRANTAGLLNDASQFLNGIDGYKATLGTPNNTVSKLMNVLADKTGIAGLSSYKSIYDMLTLDQLPRLEKTLGMTPGALSRSPKLLEKIKAIAPLPGDNQDIVNAKEANGADLFISAAARGISTYAPEQRKLLWQDLLNQHPELINRNPLLRKKLVDAGETGNYEPGSFFKAFVGGK